MEFEKDLIVTKGYTPTAEEYKQFLSDMEGQGAVLESILTDSNSRYKALDKQHLKAVYEFSRTVDYNCSGDQFDALTSLMRTLHGDNKPIPIYDRDKVFMIPMKEMPTDVTCYIESVRSNLYSLMVEQITHRDKVYGLTKLSYHQAIERLSDEAYVNKNSIIAINEMFYFPLINMLPEGVKHQAISGRPDCVVAIFDNVKDKDLMAWPQLKYAFTIDPITMPVE